MGVLDAYNSAALVLILGVFYVVRKIPAYVTICGLIVVGFIVMTVGSVSAETVSDWIIRTAGLGLCIFGLLIVRVMLIRSVSLNMLGGIQGGRENNFGENIGARLSDMRAFGLIQSQDGLNSLTPFGRVVAGVVAVLYAVFRIKG